MNYKIYIQSLNGFPIADWAVSAYMGFREKQANIIFFEDIEEVPVSPYNIVVAFIEDTNKYFNKLGIPPKRNINIPGELLSFAGRDYYYTKMEEFRQFPQFSSFVKPVYAKRFVAGVIKNQEALDVYLKDVQDEEKVMVSEVVNFVSEYRGYIINGELKGIKYYIGDIRIFPNMPIVDEAIAAFKNAPAGYSMDFGITDKGETLIVECNDGWSLGNYGLNDTTYTSLLSARWLEIMKEYKK